MQFKKNIYIKNIKLYVLLITEVTGRDQLHFI